MPNYAFNAPGYWFNQFENDRRERDSKQSEKLLREAQAKESEAKRVRENLEMAGKVAGYSPEIAKSLGEYLRSKGFPEEIAGLMEQTALMSQEASAQAAKTLQTAKQQQVGAAEAAPSAPEAQRAPNPFEAARPQTPLAQAAAGQAFGALGVDPRRGTVDQILDALHGEEGPRRRGMRMFAVGDEPYKNPGKWMTAPYERQRAAVDVFGQGGLAGVEHQETQTGRIRELLPLEKAEKESAAGQNWAQAGAANALRDVRREDIPYHKSRSKVAQATEEAVTDKKRSDADRAKWAAMLAGTRSDLAEDTYEDQRRKVKSDADTAGSRAAAAKFSPDIAKQKLAKITAEVNTLVRGGGKGQGATAQQQNKLIGLKQQLIEIEANRRAYMENPDANKEEMERYKAIALGEDAGKLKALIDETETRLNLQSPASAPKAENVEKAREILRRTGRRR